MAAAGAARTQRHPGLADLIDAEESLRAADPERLAKLRSGELSMEEYKASLRGATRSI